MNLIKGKTYKDLLLSWMLIVDFHSLLHRIHYAMVFGLYLATTTRRLIFICKDFGVLYSLLFGVSQGSVVKAVPWPLMVYFNEWLLEWRVVSFALMPHLPISMITRFWSAENKNNLHNNKLHQWLLLNHWNICFEISKDTGSSL